jgi:hypothetical protein
VLTKAIDLSITLENKPGVLAKAADAVAKAGVNVDGICAAVDGSAKPTVHFVFVRGSAEAQMALEGAGIEVKKEREVVLIDLADRPGAAAAELLKIARRGVNIDLAYLATNNRLVIGGDSAGRIWEALAADPAKATA